MTKKILYIAIPVLVLLLGALGWYFFLRPTSVLTDNLPSGGSPFGTAPSNLPGGSTGQNSSTTTTVISSNGSGNVPQLVKISGDPVAGAIVFLKNKQEVIRYANRSDGHVFDVDPLTLAKTEIANNTAPKIYEADWKADGSAVIMRTLEADGDTVDNTSISLTPPKASTQTSTSTDALYNVSATLLRGNLGTLLVIPTGLAYVLRDTGAVATSGFAGEKPTTAYSSNFTEWQLGYAGPGALTLTANASAGADGFAYLLKTGSGSLTKLLGPLTALTTLPSPDGSHLLYSYLNNGSMTLAVENLKSHAVSDLHPATLAEKCVWSQKKAGIVYCATPVGGISGNQPDDWYQGQTHFNDQIWKLDTDTGTVTLLVEPKRSYNVTLDVSKPSLSPNEDYLIFTNNTDLSLWALKL